MTPLPLSCGKNISQYKSWYFKYVLNNATIPTRSYFRIYIVSSQLYLFKLCLWGIIFSSWNIKNLYMAGAWQ